jgi:hypothetical protein
MKNSAQLSRSLVENRSIVHTRCNLGNQIGAFCALQPLTHEQKLVRDEQRLTTDSSPSRTNPQSQFLNISELKRIARRLRSFAPNSRSCSQKGSGSDLSLQSMVSILKELQMARIHFACVVLLLAIAPLFAADHRLDGSWKATIPVAGQRCSVDLVMTPEQKYSETVRCGSVSTWQAGTYIFDHGVIVRTVTDFQPKTHYVVDVNPTQPWLPANPPGHYEDNVAPPGGSYQVAFNSANSMAWKDINFGGTLTLRRR